MKKKFVKRLDNLSKILFVFSIIIPILKFFLQPERKFIYVNGHFNLNIFVILMINIVYNFILFFASSTGVKALAMLLDKEDENN